MAREQGDELGDEVVYTHPDHDREEAAYTATDRVNLEARGWRPKEKPSRSGGGSRKPAQSAAAGSDGAAAASS